MSDSTVHSEVDLVPVREGDSQNWAAIELWLRSQVTDLPGVPMEVLQFPRGHANLTFLLSFADRQLVMRRPPLGTTAPGANDMKREFRVLSRLWEFYPRAPRVYAFCEDESVTGVPFVVQEYRANGIVIFQQPPESFIDLSDLGERLTVALVDALADLHKVDYQAAGLRDFGQPEGYLERQLEGWQDRWQRVASGEAVQKMTALGERLVKEMPRSSLTSIIHNDFKLDNCQFDPASPDKVITVFDWDMATLGDPFVDVGIALDYWHYILANKQLNVPGKERFAALYAERMAIDTEQLRWYEGFASWRTGIAIQQLYKRFIDGQSGDQRHAKLGALIPQIAQRGMAVLEGKKE